MSYPRKPIMRFTWHAKKQLRERSSLSIQGTRNLISSYSIYLGLGRGGDSCLKLFWSEKDYNWFVAVCSNQQDMVITILPYLFLDKSVPQSLLNEAKVLCDNEVVGQSNNDRLYFRAYLMNRKNEVIVVPLCTLLAETHTRDLSRVSVCPKVNRIIRKRLSGVIRKGFLCSGVFVSLGPHGVPFSFTL